MAINDIFESLAFMFAGRVRAKDEIPYPERLDRSRLDASVESLHVVDRYLDFLHGRRAQLDASADLAVLRGGAYVGVVIRRNALLRYDWVEYDDYRSRHPELAKAVPRLVATSAFLVAEDDSMTMPLNKVARYIAHGDEHSVHYYASIHLEGAPGEGGPRG